MAGQPVSVVVNDPATGLPIPVQLDRAALRSALISNPDLVTETMHMLQSGQLNPAAAGAPAPGAPAAGSARLPMNTSITAMINPALVNTLSPAVRRLTKADLMALAGWATARKTIEELGLTAKDIQTVREVFTNILLPNEQRPSGFSAEAWSISCCSCTPCCCAAAEMRPQRALP